MSRKPVHVTTPYFIFCALTRERMKQAHPTAKVMEIAVMLGDRWKAMTDGEKEIYVEMYKGDKERYAYQEGARLGLTAPEPKTRFGKFLVKRLAEMSDSGKTFMTLRDEIMKEWAARASASASQKSKSASASKRNVSVGTSGSMYFSARSSLSKSKGAKKDAVTSPMKAMSRRKSM